MKKRACIWLALVMVCAGCIGKDDEYQRRNASCAFTFELLQGHQVAFASDYPDLPLTEEELRRQENPPQEIQEPAPEEILHEPETELEEQDVLTEGQDVPPPEIRWTFMVPVSALYSEFNVLVNRDNLLQENYEPSDLVKSEVKRATAADVYLRVDAATALTSMFSAASQEGYTLYLKSGYRSYGTQKTIYNNRLAANNGKDDGVSAYPGSSEHQTGLACDILNKDYAGRPRMTIDFSETEEAKWMKENCAAFGFILRYPDEKTDVTGIIFEPWHFRYVGVDVAMYIMRKGITLEEFADEWQVAVAEFQGQGGDVDEQMAYEKARANAGPQSYILELMDESGDAEVSISF